MKTGGIYLQNELFEEEKHERPQRDYLFLGWPRPICGFKKINEARIRKKSRYHLPAAVNF